MGSSTKSFRIDFSKGTLIFSAEPSRAIHEMGNMELIELKQTSATIQCSSCLKHVPEGLNMCQCSVWLRPNQSKYVGPDQNSICSFKKSLLQRTKDVNSRGMKSGDNPWQKDHHKAMDAKRGVLKRGKCASIVDRWQNDEVYRASQLVHGWTDEWVKYLDYISKIDISHDALYRQRLRYECTVYMRASIPITSRPQCQRPDYKSSGDALVSLERAQGKGVHQIPTHLRTRQNSTLDPAVSTGRRISRHFHPQHEQKAQRGGVLHLGTISGKTWHSQRWQDKRMVGDNNDNARVTHRLVRGRQSEKVSVVVKFT